MIYPQRYGTSGRRESDPNLLVPQTPWSPAAFQVCHPSHKKQLVPVSPVVSSVEALIRGLDLFFLLYAERKSLPSNENAQEALAKEATVKAKAQAHSSPLLWQDVQKHTKHIAVFYS